jgi:hypothetical protein
MHVTLNFSDGINLIVAVAAVVALIIPIWQLNKTLKTEEQNKIEDRYYSQRHEAFLVDAWIARKSNEYRIIINNQSRGSIRNVKVHVLWPSINNTDNQHDGLGYHVAPKCQKPWRLLLKGVWCVQAINKPGYASWDYPKEDTDDFASSPIFFDPHQSNVATQHALISMDFKDLYDNTWRRVYENTNVNNKVKAGLYLINTTDKRLQQFVSTEASKLD